MAFALPHLLCFLVFLQQLPIFTTAQNISLGTSLTAKPGNSSFWASPSGEFAFGFQEIGNHGFLLAIWFNKIAERTIVWSANGNSLVQKGSRVQLTSEGKIMLNDAASGKQTLIADSTANEVAYAAMLDTGNFVLANKNSANLWQSFDHPTNTILPTQTLYQGTTLFAPYTASNYSKGRFMFTLEAGGNLLLYTTHFPLDTANAAYWSSETEGTGFQVVFNQSGSIFLTSRNGSILTVVVNNTVPLPGFYRRTTIDYDGVLRYYIYPKSSNSSEGVWQMAWSTLSFIPSNICVNISYYKGGGACGFNSLCRNDQKPSCQCPNGYVFVDPDDVMRGCKQNFRPQSCDEVPSMEEFYFEEMQNTDWKESEYEKYTPVTEDWCRQACLADCFCALANFRNGDCWLKGMPLRNGRIDPSSGVKALIKIRRDNSTLKLPHSPHSRTKRNSTLLLVGSVLLSSSGFLNFLLVLITYLVVSGTYRRRPNMIQPYTVLPGMNLICFSYEELNKATIGFKEELGRGAFGTVFRGVLVSEKCVAVKRLNNMVKESELEFKAELSAIGRTNHRNLVQLLGFCNEGQHRILVYEFMSNGSLASFLFGKSRPNWYRRKEIALGTARGLLYLHEECSNQIIHCDIKPQNILLDDSFTARISDFGLAKLLKTDQTRTTTGIRGTKGYVAPEWFKNMPITTKVDVYSYGILLLEIIFCRKYFEAEAENEQQMILADWAYDCYAEKKLQLLLENDDEAMHDIDKMEKYVMIALWCIQEDPSLRPTAKKLALMLEGTLQVSVPPDPSSFTSSIV
ncbi:G-type lectin S-receptor-like serine/threonine-protein kinase LECRK2 [Rosa chinensis]|nr:G-type lectin S-receptor-like serine/threonine-protein kinase LECRK2 [Rosa chinensis]